MKQQNGQRERHAYAVRGDEVQVNVRGEAAELLPLPPDDIADKLRYHEKRTRKVFFNDTMGAVRLTNEREGQRGWSWSATLSALTATGQNWVRAFWNSSVKARDLLRASRWAWPVVM